MPLEATSGRNCTLWARFEGVTSFGNEGILYRTIFHGYVKMVEATFKSDVDFGGVHFLSPLDAALARFSQRVVFRETQIKSVLILEHAIFEQPKHVIFQSVELHPFWFYAVDSRLFEFINVTWNYEDWSSIALLDTQIPRVLSVTYRQLANNAEENHRHKEAAKFRYAAMNILRRGNYQGWAFWTLDWWYWAASGYGERILRAFLWIVIIIASFAFCYTRTGFISVESGYTLSKNETSSGVIVRPLNWQRAFVYSLEVSTFQKPEPKPGTNAARVAVTLEMLLVPVQGTLLALAIRRRFSRAS